MLPVLRMGVQGPLYQDSSNEVWQLQGIIILEKNFIPIYVLNYVFLSSNILSISLYIIAWKMRNINNSMLWLINPKFKKMLNKQFKKCGYKMYPVKLKVGSVFAP